MRFRAFITAVSLTGTALAVGVLPAAAVSTPQTRSESVESAPIKLGDPVTRTFTAISPGVVTDVVVDQIDFAKLDGSSTVRCGPPPTGGSFNPRNDEAGFALVSPSGTRVELVHAIDGSAGTWGPGSSVQASRVQMAFSDAAASVLTVPTDGGTSKPVQPLSTFIGEPAGGQWSLELTNSGGLANPMCYYGAQITVTTSPLPIVNLSGPSSLFFEGISATYTAALDMPNPYTTDISIPVSVNQGSASTPRDFVPASGTITIPPGQSAGTFTVTTIDDALDEINETYFVVLGATPTVTPGIKTFVTTEIMDNDRVPHVSIAGPASVGEGDGTATYHLVMSPASGQTAHLIWTTVEGSAKAGSDFTAASGTETLVEGETTTDVQIPILDDGVHEPDESFVVKIVDVDVAAFGTPIVITTTIVDDDPVPSVTVTGPASIGEAAGTATYTVNLSNQTAASVTVDWTLSAGTASVPGDVGPASGTVTIPAGQSSGTFDVHPVDDNVFEGDETYTVTLSNPTNATLGATVARITTITDDEAPPKATISGPASIGEAAGTATYTVSLSNPTTVAVTVPVSFVAGTATSADAYTLVANVTIPAGQSSATFGVTIVNDLLQENPETYTVVIGTPTGPATLGSSQVTTTIIDNDDRPGVELSGLDSVDEADGSLTYTVVLSTPSLHDVTVPYTLVGGTASVPGDAGPASGSVTIPAGQLSAPITLSIVDDTLAEPDETYTITLGTPSPAMPLGPTHAVTTTIIDDDVATPPPPGAPTITITGTTITEGTGSTDTIARLTVTLDHAAVGPVTVRYRTKPGTATAGLDYRTTRGTLTIPAGATTATITVHVIADNSPEPDESLRVILSRPTGATLSRTARTATITVRNDDPRRSLR